MSSTIQKDFQDDFFLFCFHLLLYSDPFSVTLAQLITLHLTPMRRPRPPQKRIFADSITMSPAPSASVSLGPDSPPHCGRVLHDSLRHGCPSLYFLPNQGHSTSSSPLPLLLLQLFAVPWVIPVSTLFSPISKETTSLYQPHFCFQLPPLPLLPLIVKIPGTSKLVVPNFSPLFLS